MARNKTQATDKEIVGIVEFLKGRATQEGSRRLFVPHSELSSLLHEDDQDNINRIRHILISGLKTRGVLPRFTTKDSIKGYMFDLKDHIDIGEESNANITAKTSAKPPKRPKSKTLTNFGTKYVIPDLFGDVRLAVQNNRRPVIIGPPGCGKSRMYEEIASALGLEAVRRPLSQVADPAELTGYLHIKEENGVSVTKFVDGTITMCAREGKMLILDEFDNASAAANEALKQITEEGGKMVIETEDGTEIVETHEDFRIAFTSNTDCRGDSTGLFPNAQSQNRATLDRIRPKFHMDYQYEVERRVLTDMGLPEPVLDALYNSAGDATKRGLVYLIRETIEKEGVVDFLGLRSLIGLAEDFNVYGWNKAFLYHVLHDFDGDFQQVVSGIIRSRLGEWAEPTRDKKKIDKGRAQREAAGFSPSTA